MKASLPAAVACRGTAIIESSHTAEQLELFADAIRLAPSPAFFTVWQDDPDSMRLFVDTLVQAGLTNPYVIQPDNLDEKLRGLERRSTSLDKDAGVIFLGCLSPMHEEERIQFNAARDRLLELQTRVIFVESVAEEKKVRLGFPDVLSLVSEDCRLFQRAGEEDPFATNDPVPPESDAKSQAPGILSGTVHEVREADAVCWLEVSPGVRVKFSVPLALLRHLAPQADLELLWSPGKEGESPRFWRREPERPDPEMIREVRELNQRFRESLNSWQPRLPKDES